MRIKYPVILIWVGAIALLAACTPKPGLPTALTDTPPAGQAAAATATSAPVEPTATLAPGKVLLAGPADSAVQAKLAELAGASGLVLESQDALSPESLTPEVKAIILLEQPANLSELLAAAPQAQFVVFTAADLPPAGNLTVIRQRAEQQAFVAGFISVLLSPDYRAAAILPSDGPLGAGLADAFIIGGRYYCGVCASGWPYNAYYPLMAAIPSGSDGPTWLASAVDLYENQKVQVYYLSSLAARTEVFDYLQGKVQLDRPVLLVGAQPAPEALRAQWAATVTFDPAAALAQVWPDVSAGTGGQVLEVPLHIKDVNTDLLGAGRMRLVDELLAELQAGRVETFTIPQE